MSQTDVPAQEHPAFVRPPVLNAYKHPSKHIPVHRLVIIKMEYTGYAAHGLDIRVRTNSDVEERIE